jgi:hypothetical protein
MRTRTTPTTAAAWRAGAPAGELAVRADVPFCRADLNSLRKVALLCERR